VNNLPALEDLRLFCTVVRNRSFVLSATELGASPASVSKRIALLEDLLGVRLLHRSTRKVSLTNDGETVYGWSLRILEDAGQMAQAVTSAKTVPQGFLRISTSSGFGRKHVAPVLSDLATQYPDLQVQLELFSRPVDVIGEGFDLDINFGAVPDSNLLVKRIAKNSRILCAAPAYLEKHGVPQTLEELTSHNCIAIRERCECFSVWRLKGPKGIEESVKVSGSLSCSDGEIPHQWSVDGHGIILRSIWDVSNNIKEGKLVRILPEYSQEADISAVYPVRLAESAKVRLCVQFLEERLTRLLPKKW
jgi:LysR family transcriptional activator of dmlA